MVRARVLTAIVLLLVVGVVWAFLNTLLFNAVIWIVSSLAIIEIFKATGLIAHRGLTALAMVQAMFIPFMRTQLVSDFVLPIAFLILLGYFAALVKNCGNMRLGSCASALLLGTIIPLFFSCAVFIRDLRGSGLGEAYIILALGAAWLSDTAAYFVGTFLGKHKLAPKVSPKKTIEGTVGGIVISTGLLLLAGVLYQNAIGVDVNLLLVGIIAPLLSVLGMLGDLTTSAIKREYGVKDFGNIMPGHGGILDRFDSVLLTLPGVYVVTTYLELIA